MIPLRLFDPRDGDPSFRIDPLNGGPVDYTQPQRSNYFTVLLIEGGGATLHSDLSEYPIHGPALAFLNPYQTFFLEPLEPLGGQILRFHANFFCIETHHAAVGCNGVLFNDPYGRPDLELDASLGAEFAGLISEMESELATAGLAHSEALVSYLKVFLIKATRLKLRKQEGTSDLAEKRRPELLDRLIELVERDYQKQHSPRFYADSLSVTPKALGRLVKQHLGRSLSEMIRDRIIRHAKWQLLHTLRPVKEIAWELGFADELYFSRFFKRCTGCAPTGFRAYETTIRGGRNLSMQ